MAHWRLGEVLEALGQRAKADAHYRRSLALGGRLKEERASAYATFQKRR